MEQGPRTGLDRALRNGQKHGGVILMTGVCQLMATSSIGGIDKEGEVVGWRCMLETVMIASSTSVVKTGWSVFVLESGGRPTGQML